jgi:hypothetical protein
MRRFCKYFTLEIIELILFQEFKQAVKFLPFVIIKELAC